MTRYCYDRYFAAKLAMYMLWRPGSTLYPHCAVCGRPCITPPEAHHVFLSQRYTVAHNDLRNLAPVHNQMDGPCHQKRAHGNAKQVIANRLYLVLGDGDAEKGRAIVEDAWTNDWVPGLKLDIPEIGEAL